MPRGGRRPGAGAPKGNLNGLKSGRYSPRVRFALAAMLAVPDYRAVINALMAEGEHARAQFDGLMTDSLRILYDRPVSDEIRQAVARARQGYLERVGRGPAGAAVKHEQRVLGVDDVLRRHRRRRATRANDPRLQRFMTELLSEAKRT